MLDRMYIVSHCQYKAIVFKPWSFWGVCVYDSQWPSV